MKQPDEQQELESVIMSTFLRSGFAALALTAAMSTGALAHDRDFDGEAEASTKREAIAAAIADWKHEVYEETGHWVRWKTATHKKIECESERDGDVECEVEAVPAH